jgi:hypothetical protein
VVEKMSEVVSLLCAAMLLLVGAGCNRSAPIAVPDASEPDDTDSETEGETGGDTDADTDSDGDTDADTDSDTDTDSESATELPPCIYECVPSTAGCGNRGSYLHTEMACPDPGDVCCDYKKFEDSWECLICTEPYPTGAGRHDLRV